jgi:hypothetical protein
MSFELNDVRFGGGWYGKLQNPYIYFELATESIRTINSQCHHEGLSFAPRAMVMCGCSHDLDGQCQISIVPQFTRDHIEI